MFIWTVRFVFLSIVESIYGEDADSTCLYEFFSFSYSLASSKFEYDNIHFYYCGKEISPNEPVLQALYGALPEEDPKRTDLSLFWKSKNVVELHFIDPVSLPPVENDITLNKNTDITKISDNPLLPWEGTKRIVSLTDHILVDKYHEVTDAHLNISTELMTLFTFFDLLYEYNQYFQFNGYSEFNHDPCIVHHSILFSSEQRNIRNDSAFRRLWTPLLYDYVKERQQG